MQPAEYGAWDHQPFLAPQHKGRKADGRASSMAFEETVESRPSARSAAPQSGTS